jgi:hypothetical protein
MLVLKRSCPVTGLAGRCAVVPTGSCAAPVAESALISTPAAAGTLIVKFDAVSTALIVIEPPAGALSRMFPAIIIPYAQAAPV